ncbi:hypothetical protein J3R30DRAFT_3521531, partial [Lentinula aciculospora]
TTSLSFRFHASFYIALLFTHLIPTALLMDTSDSYCRSSRLRREISLTASYVMKHLFSIILFFYYSFLFLL